MCSNLTKDYVRNVEKYSEILNRNLIEDHDVMPMTGQGTRRYKFIVPLIVLALLAFFAVAVFLDNYVFTPRSQYSLSHERKLGLSDAAIGECTTAIPLLSSVVAANSSDFAAKESLGLCYEAQGENGTALTLLQAVAEAEPSLSNELAVAKAAFFSGRSNLVQSAMNEAAVIAVSPNDVLSVVQIDQSYGLYPVAAAALRRTQPALRTYAWFSADAATQLDLGNPGAAVNSSVRAVQLAPTSSRGGLLTELGSTYMDAGEYLAAANAYQKAISTRQPIDISNVYTELAQCYINSNRYSKALATTQFGIENTAGTGKLNLQITEATALAEMNHTLKAIQVLESIMASSSAPANVAATAGAMLSALGH